MADTQRLVLEVDASVQLAARNLDRLRKSLDDVEGAGKKAGREIERVSAVSAGQRQAGLQQLAFQINDVSQGFASAGFSAQTFARVFGQQASQVVQAITVMQGSATGFVGFLAGPWGAAATAAVTVLISLGAKLFEASDAAGDASKATDVHRMSLQDLIKAIGEESAALKKSIETSLQAEQATYARATAARQEAKDRLNNAVAALQEAKAIAQADAVRSAGPGQRGELGTLAATESTRRVAALDAQISTLQAAVGAADQYVRRAQAPILQRQAEASRDPSKAAQLRYEQAVGRLNQEYDRGKLSAAGYANAMLAAGRALDRDQDRIREAEREGRRRASTRSGLPSVTLSDVTSLLQGDFGGRVTSTTRSAGRNAAVGGAKNSYHLAGQAVDFVPRGGMGSLSKDQIKEALLAQGIKPLEVLGPGDKGHSDHYHVAFSKTRMGPDQVARAQAAGERSAARDKSRGLTIEDRFQDELARVDQQLIEARSKLVEGVQAQADAQKARIAQEEQAYVANVNRDQNMSAVHKQQLIAERQKLTKQLQANVDQQTAEELGRQALEVQQEQARGEQAALQHLASLAGTREERLRLELQLNDLIYEQQKREIEGMKISDELKAARLANLRAEHDRNRVDIERRNDSPMAQYLDQLNKAGANLNDSFQEIRVRGLQSLNDGLVDAIMGTRKLGDVFKDVSRQIIGEILQIVIQQQLIKPIANLLGGGGVGGGGGGFLGKLLGIASSAAGASLGKGELKPVGKRAAGGPISAGLPYLVGEKGPEIVVPRASGIVVPNHQAFGRGGGGELTVRVLSDNDMFDARVEQVSGGVFARNAPRLAGVTKASTLRDATRPRIMG